MTTPNLYENFTHLRFERSNAVLKITLDRPPLNAVNDALQHDLTRLFATLIWDLLDVPLPTVCALRRLSRSTAKTIRKPSPH